MTIADTAKSAATTVLKVGVAAAGTSLFFNAAKGNIAVDPIMHDMGLLMGIALLYLIAKALYDWKTSKKENEKMQNPGWMNQGGNIQNQNPYGFPGFPPAMGRTPTRGG